MIYYTFWGITCGISTSLLYVTIKDIRNKGKTNLNDFSNFINPGLYFGIAIGLFRAYNGKSLLY
jgi:hypothetical protein